MAVFTVMAEENDGQSFKLHNEAVKDAGQALVTVERFRTKGFQSIRVYRETDEINLDDLRRAVAAERS